MEHYVTLFNYFYLPQGLALHLSMERFVGEYTLWILCIDDDVYFDLNKLNLSHVKLLQLSRLETEDLLRVRSERSVGEYCWTLTPFAPRFVFEADVDVARVTYIDADMWFRASPRLIFEEFERSGKSVLITEHAYAPENDCSELSGVYCVQFMTFLRGSSEPVRKAWENQCIEWCYARYEDGRFGDQKYLDVWPQLYSNIVHVLQNRHLILGPWNGNVYPYGTSILYHFQGLRVGKKIVFAEIYPLPAPLIKNIYNKYAVDLKYAIDKMECCLGKKVIQTDNKFYSRIFGLFRGIKNNLWKIYYYHEYRRNE